MTLPLTRLKGTKPISWTTILGIVLVPLTVAGVLLWGLWNPTERLENVTAAVVNNDKPVEVNGQTVPLGRVLAGELIGGDTAKNFTWQLTDKDDAKQGLKDGRYATVITIPENFSAAATSLSEGPEKAKTAHIDIAESDKGKLIDTALSGIVTQTATSVLNQQLGAQFVGNVFVGMTELHNGVGKAADGATKLADGGSQLSEGADQLTQGTVELSEGAQQLSSGVSGLSTGAQQLSGGVLGLSEGAQQLSSGVSGLSTGAQQLSGGVSGLSEGAQELSSGVSGLSAGAGSLATGVNDYVAGATTLSETYEPLAVGAGGAVTQLKTIIGAMGALKNDSVVPQQQLTDGLTAAGAGVATLGADIGTLYVDCLGSGATQTFCDGMRDTLGARAGEIGGGITSASTGATGLGTAMGSLETALTDPNADPNVDPIAQLALLSDGLKTFGTGLSDFATQGATLSTGATELVTGASKLSNGAAGLATGASQLSTGAAELATGASQLSTGAAELATGTSQLSAGASDLVAGTSQLSTGASALAEGTPDLVDGATQLADGVSKSADGANDLAKGLDEAAAGIPNYTKQQRETLSEKAVTPVEMRGGSDEIFTSSGAPLFAGIALWAGALASFLVLAPLWRRTRDAARGIGYITVRSALPTLAIGAVQGAIAGVILPAALGYDLTQATEFFGFALLTGIAFALVAQGLSALFGGLGRFITFALLVVAFAVGVVSTVPGPLAAIGDLSPIGSALSGFQAIASGSGGAGGSTSTLLVWAFLGLILTALAVGRARRAKE